MLNKLTVEKDSNPRFDFYTISVDGRVIAECVGYDEIGDVVSIYLRNPAFYDYL